MSVAPGSGRRCSAAPVGPSGRHIRGLGLTRCPRRPSDPGSTHRPAGWSPQGHGLRSSSRGRHDASGAPCRV
eukprot:13212595-Alexandrium_andersonii.AAC.1